MKSIPASSGAQTIRPVALVYRGPAGCPGCSEAVATLLQNSQWGFEVHYGGPHERLHISDATLKAATLYAQPGGNGTVEEAFALLQANASSIRKFVKEGGRYLGSCMGAYLAGSDPGFHLLPAILISLSPPPERA